MHLARRLARIGTADVRCSQSQCLRHHTRALTGSSASLPCRPPETHPSTLCVLQAENWVSMHCSVLYSLVLDCLLQCRVTKMYVHSI